MNETDRAIMRDLAKAGLNMDQITEVFDIFACRYNADKQARYRARKRAKSERVPREVSEHGTRFNAEAIPDPIRTQEAVRLGLTVAEVAGVFAQFSDYWNAAPGQRGRKSDWLATWRNWVREHIARMSKPRVPAVPAPYVKPDPHAYVPGRIRELASPPPAPDPEKSKAHELTPEQAAKLAAFRNSAAIDTGPKRGGH
jgi:hypothetical protein